MNPLVASLLPSLFVANERVALFGEWTHGFFSYTAVGATNVGSIRIAFDEQLTTNTYAHDWSTGFNALDAVGLHMPGSNPAHKPGTVHARDYSPPVSLGRGDDVGLFELGSTVVLIFEAPSSFEWGIKAGEPVVVGMPLGGVPGTDDCASVAEQQLSAAAALTDALSSFDPEDGGDPDAESGSSASLSPTSGDCSPDEEELEAGGAAATAARARRAAHKHKKAAAAVAVARDAEDAVTVSEEDGDASPGASTASGDEQLGLSLGEEEEEEERSPTATASALRKLARRVAAEAAPAGATSGGVLGPACCVVAGSEVTPEQSAATALGLLTHASPLGAHPPALLAPHSAAPGSSGGDCPWCHCARGHVTATGAPAPAVLVVPPSPLPSAGRRALASPGAPRGGFPLGSTASLVGSPGARVRSLSAGGALEASAVTGLAGELLLALPPAISRGGAHALHHHHAPSLSRARGDTGASCDVDDFASCASEVPDDRDEEGEGEGGAGSLASRLAAVVGFSSAGKPRAAVGAALRGAAAVDC